MLHEPTIPGPAEVVVFQWSTQHGHCVECGLPAAFYRLDAYGPGKNMRACSVCAANAAADGEAIARIDEHP